MAEHIDDATRGYLSDRRQAAANEVDRLRREFEGLKNNLEEEEQNLAAIDSLISHLNTKGN
jgi:predicted  nucleic acid-binding Zn-ribbon protein